MLSMQMADVMVHEIVEGVEGSGGVRCGVIGEVGCSWPLTESERRSLEAAAIAQRETGELATINILNAQTIVIVFYSMILEWDWYRVFTH